ncbi:alpha/beta fold hydrolase [Nocardioides marmorisolisilvae]|uniref:Alpha/beta hydrolase n=1 Tax=Nocardioides marmorisolisilvae TaxID=1542737 RepID=A0A3N0DWW2_9ACTN|nr:alpha/beta family hydrolase [Nocardioides marmorisolisilvae]RNL79933.1 alpha/beta hydrolase [Nocardioides marmorisolisilvae]
MIDRLTLSALPEVQHGLVLMLHGGAERGTKPVDERSLAFRRTRAMFGSVADDLVSAGIGVGLLQFRVKGWNAAPGRVPAPVADARAALADLHADFPDQPIVLLGHSMGARTAAWVADQPGVVGVVGLAPWFPHDDPVDALAGKHLVAAHGRRDRITSAKATRIFVQRAAGVADSVEFIDMGGLGHYMLRGINRWNQVAVSQSRAILDRVREDR